MMAPNKPGTVKLDVFVKSDSYIGLDQQKAVEFEVISASTLPQYEPHPDDLELDNEPTLFEQVMQAYDDETDSEDEVRLTAPNGRRLMGHSRCSGPTVSIGDNAVCLVGVVPYRRVVPYLVWDTGLATYDNNQRKLRTQSNLLGKSLQQFKNYRPRCVRVVPCCSFGCSPDKPFNASKPAFFFLWLML